MITNPDWQKGNLTTLGIAKAQREAKPRPGWAKGCGPRCFIQLPDGNWVNPRHVSTIFTWPAILDAGGRRIYPIRVYVLGEGIEFTFDFETMEAANKLRDELARKIMGEQSNG